MQTSRKPSGTLVPDVSLGLLKTNYILLHNLLLSPHMNSRRHYRFLLSVTPVPYAVALLFAAPGCEPG